MTIFIVYIALCFVAGIIAYKKGRSNFGFFCLALFLSPIVGILGAIIVSPNVAAVENQQLESGNHKKCVYCAEIIKSEARVCRFCGRDIASST